MCTYQHELSNICFEILNGKRIDTIFASLTPGSEKSTIPQILAKYLTPQFAKSIVWIVRRNILVGQCQKTLTSESIESVMTIVDSKTVKTLNKSFWNDLNADGFILFIDNPQMDKEGLSFFRHARFALEKAKLTTIASGTYSTREMKSRLQTFIPLEKTRTVNYTKEQALLEKNILPVVIHSIPNSFTVKKNKEKITFSSLNPKHAQQLLFKAYTEWKVYKKQELATAKLLVIAPKLDTAFDLFNLLNDITGRMPLVANNTDSSETIAAINKFQENDLTDPDSDILIVVGESFFGLSIKEITHVACITYINSMELREHCFSRANRPCNGKEKGFIFSPYDLP